MGRKESSKQTAESTWQLFCGKGRSKLNRLRLKNRRHFLLKEVVAFQLTGNAANDDLDDLDEYMK